MLTTKVFIKKTKKGGVMKIVREHYLRDDITCGSCVCQLCDHKCEKQPLEGKPNSRSSLVTRAHYLLPDTNVVLHQIDVIEDPSITNVVILQTVLEEVKHRSVPAYKRYQSHLDGVDILLITNDSENRNKATEAGLEAYTVNDYVKSLQDSGMLIDRLANPLTKIREPDYKSSRATVRDVRDYYEEYVKIMDLEQHFKDFHIVTSIQKVFHLRNGADRENGEVELCCQNVQQNHNFIWEVRGYRVVSYQPSEQADKEMNRHMAADIDHDSKSASSADSRFTN